MLTNGGMQDSDEEKQRVRDAIEAMKQIAL